MKNKYSKSDLKLLSTNDSLISLLSSKKPDFDSVLREQKYLEAITELQTKLIKLQNWIVENDEKLIILFEGREFAGKGGAIRIFAEHLNPRSIRQVALPKPTPTEEGQWYFQRYIAHLPQAGEIVFFDRSWYNRAVIEPVNKFCTKKQYEVFLEEVPYFERMLTNENIKLIKFYLSISKDQQKERIESVRKDPLRRWELSPVDEKALDLWDKYTNYTNWMLYHTHTQSAPWVVINGNNKEEARLQMMNHVIDQYSHIK